MTMAVGVRLIFPVSVDTDTYTSNYFCFVVLIIVLKYMERPGRRDQVWNGTRLNVRGKGHPVRKAAQYKREVLPNV